MKSNQTVEIFSMFACKCMNQIPIKYSTIIQIVADRQKNNQKENWAKQKRRGLNVDVQNNSSIHRQSQKKNLDDGFRQSELSSNNAVILNPHFKTNMWHAT